MAVVKTIPIKSTVRRALDYIGNPDKTDGKLLISSFACSFDIADLEFEMVRRSQKIKKGDNLARHMIQSFSPEDNITPEQAHEIGKRWADKILGGKYQYVICTHIDRGHIHNHIVFNAVSFVDYKKYVSNKYTYRKMREYSDSLCREYGLSVIENPQKSRSRNTNIGKKYHSHRDKLSEDIDKAIQTANDFEEFLKLMRNMGYEINTENLAFLYKDWKKYVRAESLGDDYSIANIQERIITKRPAISRRLFKNNRDISLLIDIRNNIKAQESRGYEHWAKINNLKQASKTINFLTENGIHTYEELIARINEMNRSFTGTVDNLKSVEKQIDEINVLKNHLQTYQTLRPIYAEYKKSKNKDDFERKHQSEIILYEASRKYLSSVYTEGRLPKAEILNKKLAKLTEQKQKLYNDYRKSKKALAEMDIIKANVDMILNIPKRTERMLVI